MKKFTEAETKITIDQFDNWAIRNPAIAQLIQNQNEIIDWIAKENKIKGRPDIVKK